MLRVNGVDMLPYLKEYSVIVSDLDSDLSGRNAKGEMLRDRIRTLRKLNVSFNPMTTGEVSKILTAVKEKFFDVTYLDPVSGGEKTGKFYVGDRTVPVYGRILYNGAEQWLWNGASFNLIEK